VTITATAGQAYATSAGSVNQLCRIITNLNALPLPFTTTEEDGSSYFGPGSRYTLRGDLNQSYSYLIATRTPSLNNITVTHNIQALMHYRKMDILNTDIEVLEVSLSSHIVRSTATVHIVILLNLAFTTLSSLKRTQTYTCQTKPTTQSHKYEPIL
jgi:hypothetical protein